MHQTWFLCFIAVFIAEPALVVSLLCAKCSVCNATQWPVEECVDETCYRLTVASSDDPANAMFQVGCGAFCPSIASTDLGTHLPEGRARNVECFLCKHESHCNNIGDDRYHVFIDYAADINNLKYRWQLVEDDVKMLTQHSELVDEEIRRVKNEIEGVVKRRDAVLDQRRQEEMARKKAAEEYERFKDASEVVEMDKLKADAFALQDKVDSLLGKVERRLNNYRNRMKISEF